MNTIERNQLLTALYQVTSKSDLLKQFNDRLSEIDGIFRERKIKKTMDRRYTYLLEQIVFYSHAIIYGHGVQMAQKYRGYFMTVAKNSKSLKLDSNKIEEAFSFLNRTEKREVLAKTQTDTKEIVGDCVAKNEIARLKAQLDGKTYEIPKGYEEGNKKGLKVESLEIYIKVSLVALSTGARLSDIMEDLTIFTKKGIVYFNDGIKTVKGVILGLDTKTVQRYLKDIRSHYSEQIEKGADLSTGIRKSILDLNIKFEGNSTKRTFKNRKTKKVIKVIEYKDVATSLNHLNTLYKECFKQG